MNHGNAQCNCNFLLNSTHVEVDVALEKSLIHTKAKGFKISEKSLS